MLWGEAVVFYFPLPYPSAKLLHCCQMPDIAVAIIMSEVAVLTVAIVSLATVASLTSLSLNLSLGLDLIPPSIVIYSPLPNPNIFDLDLNLNPAPVPVHGLNHHQILDCPRNPPLLEFADGLIFSPGYSILPGIERV